VGHFATDVYPVALHRGSAGFFTFVSGIVYVTDGFRQLGAHGQSDAS
jgi:hypothetical protein